MRKGSIKFYKKHHWDRGKVALGLGPDRIKAVVSMAIDSSHRVIMEKTVSPLLAVFHLIHFILAGNDDMHGSLESSKFSQIRPPTAELAAFECLKKSS